MLPDVFVATLPSSIRLAGAWLSFDNESGKSPLTFVRSVVQDVALDRIDVNKNRVALRE